MAQDFSIEQQSALLDILNHAVSNNDEGMVADCLTHAPDLRQCADKSGRTILHVIDYKGFKPEILQLLIDAGADVNARDRNGDTPLHFIARNQSNRADPALVTYLVSQGADPMAANAKNIVAIAEAQQASYKSLEGWNDDRKKNAMLKAFMTPSTVAKVGPAMDLEVSETSTITSPRLNFPGKRAGGGPAL